MRKDVYLFDTLNGGDITADLEIRDGLETAVYLSLFGGNVLDDGREKNEFNWWGNIFENEQSKIYRGTAAYLLRTIPPAPKNLRRIEDAAKNDLAWLVTDGYTDTIAVTASMPGLNKVKLSIFIEGIDPLEFRSDWGADDIEIVSSVVPTPVAQVNDGILFSGTGLPRATLVFVNSQGDITSVPISDAGTWSIDPYPLNAGEVGQIYVETASGLKSKIVSVTGVAAVLYNGEFYYDGSQEYDGIRIN